VLLGNEAPVFGAIVEAQLQPDPRKLYTWPLYALAARARYECPFVVIVVTPDPATARWAARPIDLGNTAQYRVHVIGPEAVPEITDAAQATGNPSLAMLSVMAHGQGDPATAVRIATAAAAAIQQLPEDKRLLYSALIETALSEVARKAFEMLPETQQFLSESQRRSFAKGRAEGKSEGKAEGKAEAVLRILGKRAIAVSDEQRQRILACGDVDALDCWLDRALTAAAADELFA